MFCMINCDASPR